MKMRSHQYFVWYIYKVQRM